LEGLIFRGNSDVAVFVGICVRNLCEVSFGLAQLFSVFGVARDICWDFDVVWRLFVLSDVVWRLFVLSDVVWRLFVLFDVVWRLFVLFGIGKEIFCVFGVGMDILCAVWCWHGDSLCCLMLVGRFQWQA
jgi:hypothetical protein